jgi:hypothetical protein
MVKVIYQEHETPGASTLSKETREKCISCWWFIQKNAQFHIILWPYEYE